MVKLNLTEKQFKSLVNRAFVHGYCSGFFLELTKKEQKEYMTNVYIDCKNFIEKEESTNMAGIKGQRHNPYIGGKYAFVNKNDVVFTPDWLAKKICSMFPISGMVLEPCKGEGVFLKYLPQNTLWCEIAEGKNFFDFAVGCNGTCVNKPKIDWIVTNPPYSDFDRFLDHSFEIADNVVLLVPIAKIMKGTLKKVFAYGGIVSCHFLGGGQAGFPFGFPVGIYHFKKDYKGETKFDLLPIPAQKERWG